MNQNVNARVDWRDLGVSFFRHFPNLTLTLDDLTAVGSTAFRATPWPRCKHLRHIGQPAQRAGECPGRERPDRGPRRRARSASALADRAGGRHGKLGYHERVARRADASRQGHGPESAPLRDQGRRHRLRQSPSQAQGDAQGPRPVPQRRLQPEPGRRPDSAQRRHRQRELRRDPLSQPGQARPHRRRRGPTSPRKPTPSRTPSSASTTSSSASPVRPNRSASSSVSTSRSRRRAPTSAASCRWCRRCTPATSTR